MAKKTRIPIYCRKCKLSVFPALRSAYCDECKQIKWLLEMKKENEKALLQKRNKINRNV